MTRALFFFAFSAYAAGNPIPSGFLNHPLAFEPNRGQAATGVQFLARGNSRDYLLNASGVTVSGASMRFLGANARPHTLGQEPLAERHNYFHGPVSQTDVPTYRRIRYSSLYPGIDCVFYGDQKGLEFDFEVSPGADPDKIRLGWSGARQVRLDANGELMIETVSGELRQRRPTMYQERNGQRVLITGGYVLAADGEIRFSLGPYDRNLPLIIDPVLFALEQGVILITAMAGDPAGNVYLTGTTFASVIPTTVGAVQPSFGGGVCPVLPVIGGGYTTACPDAFVIKLNPTGQLIYATYLGGDGADGGNAIVADSSGNAYVAGSTSPSPTSSANNFPITANAAFPKPSSTGNDGFITKLNPAGNQLVYSTFIPTWPPRSPSIHKGTYTWQVQQFPNFFLFRLRPELFRLRHRPRTTPGLWRNSTLRVRPLYMALILVEAAPPELLASPSMPWETPTLSGLPNQRTSPLRLEPSKRKFLHQREGPSSRKSRRPAPAWSTPPSLMEAATSTTASKRSEWTPKGTQSFLE
jgi:hypothetical protein